MKRKLKIFAVASVGWLCSVIIQIFIWAAIAPTEQEGNKCPSWVNIQFFIMFGAWIIVIICTVKLWFPPVKKVIVEFINE